MLTLALACLVSRVALGGVNLPVPYMAQPDNQTCLPTCLTMTLHFMGRVELTTDTVQRFHKRTRYDRYNLPGILSEYGLYALPNWTELGWHKDTIKHELDSGRPVILGVNQGPAGHFVLAVGYTDDDHLILNDPTRSYPGYDLGGDHVVVDWHKLLWRGGCLVRPEPFPQGPAISGKLTTATCAQRLFGGEQTQAVFEIKNTGHACWPEDVCLRSIDPWSSPTQERANSFFASGKWISPTRVCSPEKKAVAPGEVARFVVPLNAPQVAKPATYHEYFGLIDGQGRSFSDSYLAGPGNWELSLRVVVDPASSSPLSLPEAGSPQAASLPLQVKFGALEQDTQTTPPPTKASVRKLLPRGRYDVAWTGSPASRQSAWRDYHAEAWVYCELRREQARRGWDRIGLFVRDNGQLAADTKDEVELAESYAMTFDSDDGGVRAANITNGGVDDFRPGARYKLKDSGWHKFALDCRGDQITWYLDDQPFHTQRDSSLASGECGVFCHNAFPEPAQSQGVRFAGFRVERLAEAPQK